MNDLHMSLTVNSAGLIYDAINRTLSGRTFTYVTNANVPAAPAQVYAPVEQLSISLHPNSEHGATIIKVQVGRYTLSRRLFKYETSIPVEISTQQGDSQPFVSIVVDDLIHIGYRKGNQEIYHIFKVIGTAPPLGA